MRRLAVMPAVLIGLAWSAGGCAVDQEKEVAEYRGVLAMGPVPPAPRPGDAIALAPLLQLANQRDERLAIEGENYLQALIARKRAVAAFLPTVNLVPSYVYRERSASGIPFLDDPTQLDVPVTASWSAFRGFQDVAALRGAEVTIEERQSLLLDLRESLLVDAARVFYQVLRSERSVVVLERSLERQEERVRDMQAREQAGMARPLDTAQTEAQASDTRLQLINARNDVEQARTTLAFLTGVDLRGVALHDDFEVPESVPTMSELIARAGESRHDLVAAEAAVAAARFEIQRAVGQYYPSLGIDLDYFLTRDSLPTDRDWSSLITLNLPIFTGGRIHEDVRRAWSLFRQAELQVARTYRQVQDDVAHAFHDLIASTARLAEVKTELAAAEEAFAQADETYNVGLSTNLERLAAQDELLTAQLRLASEQFDRKAFYLDLVRTIGSLAELVAARS